MRGRFLLVRTFSRGVIPLRVGVVYVDAVRRQWITFWYTYNNLFIAFWNTHIVEINCREKISQWQSINWLEWSSDASVKKAWKWRIILKMSLFRGMFLSGYMCCWTWKMKLLSLLELTGLVSSKNEKPKKVGMYYVRYFKAILWLFEPYNTLTFHAIC